MVLMLVLQTGGEIYESMALIAMFTMGFVALLSVFWSINTNNVVYAAKARLAVAAPHGGRISQGPTEKPVAANAPAPHLRGLFFNFDCAYCSRAPSLKRRRSRSP